MPRRVAVAARTALVRVLFASCLEGAGFEVWAAESGVDALDLCVRRPDDVAAVVGEEDLPDLPAEVRAWFHEAHPAVPCHQVGRGRLARLADDVTDAISASAAGSG